MKSKKTLLIGGYCVAVIALMAVPILAALGIGQSVAWPLLLVFMLLMAGCAAALRPHTSSVWLGPVLLLAGFAACVVGIRCGMLIAG